MASTFSKKGPSGSTTYTNKTRYLRGDELHADFHVELARLEVVGQNAHVRERRHVERRGRQALLPSVAHEGVEVGVGGRIGCLWRGPGGEGKGYGLSGWLVLIDD